MLCKILIINMLDYKFKRFIFNIVIISIFKDGIDDKHFAIEENIPLANVKSGLTIECLPRGGFVAVIK